MRRVAADAASFVREALAQHEAALMRYAKSITGDVERARDVVQETFVRLWQADREQIGEHVAPWLFTVCRNRALDVARKEGRMQPVGAAAVEVAAETSDTPLAQTLRKEATSRVLAGVEGLPANQREIVRLKFQAGLSYKEISAVTGLTVSNVGYLLHHAIKALRDSVEGAA